MSDPMCTAFVETFDSLGCLRCGVRPSEHPEQVRFRFGPFPPMAAGLIDDFNQGAREQVAWEAEHATGGAS